MTRSGAALLLWALLAWPAPRAEAVGAAEIAAPTAEGAIMHGIGLTRHAVAQGSDETAHSRGHLLQALVNGYTPVYAAKMHEVQRAEIDGEASTIDKVLSDSDAQLAKGGGGDL